MLSFTKTLVFLLFLLVKTQSLNIEGPTEDNEIIYLYKRSAETIRLKSVLSIFENEQSEPEGSKRKQIFWIFKRIFSVPSFSLTELGNVKSSIETSPKEQMISLDLDVESNLKEKYSISGANSTSPEPSSLLNYDLIIHDLTYADSGLYICNQWNHKTIYYQLVVLSPIVKPEVKVLGTTSPDNENLIRESSNVTIKCLSKNSYPYPSFRWFMNGKQILATNSMVNLSFNQVDSQTNTIESQLKITNVTSDFHLKNFTCQLVQAISEPRMVKTEEILEESETSSLNIAFKPIVFVYVQNLKTKKILTSAHFNAQSITLFNNSNLVFKSETRANPDKVSVLWLIDGVVQNTKMPLEFNWLKRSNYFDSNAKSMILTVRVKNSIGTSEMKFKINVAYSPKIIAPTNTKYEVTENKLFQLICKVEAYPQPKSIQWVHFPDVSYGEKKFQIASNTSLLQMPEISHSQATGYFVCVATNQMKDSFNVEKVGKVVSQKFELNVRFKPQVTAPNEKIAANLTELTISKEKLTQRLICQSMANPKPKFTWFKDGVKITDQSKYLIRNNVAKNKPKHFNENTLTINDLGIVDVNSVYDCEASNSLGSSRVRISLVPMSKPDAPTNLKSVNTDFMSTTLTWLPGFNGGLSQKFQLNINNTVFDLETNKCQNFSLCLERATDRSVTIQNLKFNSIYSIEISSRNEMGTSDKQEPIIIKTSDLTIADTTKLPQFKSLSLNVPSNQIDFDFKEASNVHYCFKILTISNSFNSCIPITRNQRKLSLDFNTKLIKSMKIVTCFTISPKICTSRPFTATIDRQNKSPRKPLNPGSSIRHDDDSIPLSLIIGISICILSLLIFLVLCICYCIRRKNLRICKSLLTTTQLNVSEKDPHIRPLSNLSSSTESEKKSAHLNKTFNIDIASISAPIGKQANSLTESSASDSTNSAGYGTAGSGLNVINGSMSSSITEANGKRTKLNEILVIEDSEQQLRAGINHSKSLKLNKLEEGHMKTQNASLSKSSSSTGVSNCSSLNTNLQTQNNQYLYSEFINSFDQNDSCVKKDFFSKGVTYIDTYNHNSSSSAGSNTDPIAINNSLSSNNSSGDNSPTYGYNVTSATATAIQKPEVFEDQDNMLYIKTGINQKNFTQSKDSRHSIGTSTATNQPQSSSSSTSGTSSSKHNSFHGNQFSDSNAPESGYSTPSRLKKVVYEVIV